MKSYKHPLSFNYKNIYPDVKLIHSFEGGVVYKATKDGKYYLIFDEGTMDDFLLPVLILLALVSVLVSSFLYHIF
jgi:hypothetical protein